MSSDLPPPAAPRAPTASTAVDPTSLRSIWRIAWPVTISMSAHTAFELIDLYWIGALGTDAIAGVSLVGNVLFCLFVLTEIVYLGTLAMVTRRIGAGELAGPTGAEGVAAQVLPLGAALGLALTVPGVLLVRPIVMLFGAPEAVGTAGVAYLSPMMLTFLPAFLYMTLSAIFTATGDTRTPMYIGVGANIVNAVADPFFIFGWGGLPALGVAGAAVASLLSSVLSTLAMLAAYRYRHLPFPRAPLWRWHGTHAWRTVLRIGIPGSVGMLTRPLSTLLLFGIMARLGAEGVAAFGITVRALSPLWLFHVAVSTAVSTLTGQALGAHNLPGIRRLVRRSIVFNVACAAALGLPLFVWARELIALFEATNAEVLRLGALFMRLLVVAKLASSFSEVWAAVMNGAGDTRPAMFTALLANWGVKLPLAYALALPAGYGVPGIWWAMFVSLLVETGTLLVWYRTGRWTHAHV